MKSGKDMMQKNVSNEELKKYSLVANKEVASIAAELIAFRELKSKQVPVAWYHTTLALAKSDEDKKSLPGKIASRYSIPLFTVPQKSVVLLPKFTDRHTCMNAGCDAASAYKEDVIALNKAFGGTVKESE